MKIVVNTRLLLPGKLEGIGWFTHETLRRITAQHPEHEFIFLFDRPYHEQFIYGSNVTPVVKGPETRHLFLWHYWFEKVVPKVLKRHNADLFLSPDGYLSLRAKSRSLVVMHDLNFEHYPKDLPFMARKYYRKYFPKFARKATRIATVSEYSKQDIINCYQIPPGKIDVIYNGANEAFTPLSEEQQKQVRKKYSNNCPYFVYVGSLNPRKNISNLLLAFDAFKKASDSPFKLLLVGEKMWHDRQIDQTYQQLQFREDVLFTGRLEMEKLKNIIGAAHAMTYVSKFEGFGIPVLEAMYCDVPVITSNVTSMPEVAGNAALLADPFTTTSIKEAMLKIATDNNLRQQLIENGRAQREKFTWDKSAANLWKSIEKTMQQ